MRTASKEENLIFPLQTQLTLQTKLRGQYEYEVDLLVRDKLVEMLGNKLAEVEKEEEECPAYVEEKGARDGESGKAYRRRTGRIKAREHGEKFYG
jgi:hypothetical protein